MESNTDDKFTADVKYYSGFLTSQRQFKSQLEAFKQNWKNELNNEFDMAIFSVEEIIEQYGDKVTNLIRTGNING